MTSMYFGAFCLSYQRKVSAYAICFLVIVLAGAFMYCQTSKIEYSLLGSSSLIFVCLFYVINFKTFMLLTVISIAGFIVCIISNWNSLSQELWDDQPVVFSLTTLSFVYLASISAALVSHYKNEKLLKDEFFSGTKIDGNSMKAKELLSLLLP